MKKLLLFILIFLSCSFKVLAKDEYLTDILINGESLEEFDKEKTEYNLEVESNVEKIKIVYVYDDTIYKGKGTSSDLSLKYGLNQSSITLTDIETNLEVKTYKVNVTRKDNRSSENSLYSLTVADKKVELTEKLEYDVYVSNTLKNASIKAVLKNSEKSKFVSGYGERVNNNLVTLNGEKTKVEIKIQAENESIKTYLINIIKEDYKNNDTTLKSLTIDKINFDFKSNIYEYNLNVSNDIDKIILTPTKNHEKQTIEYQKEIDLKDGINNIMVKVIAEDGSSKNYVFNILKEETKNLVNDIKISNVDFLFQENIFEYDLKTNLKELEFNVTLNYEDANFKINNNENLENGSVVTLEVIKDDIKEEYHFNILNEIKEEETKPNSNNNQTDDNKIQLFLAKYEMYIGLSVFGIGVFSLLVSILTKAKKSKIM